MAIDGDSESSHRACNTEPQEDYVPFVESDADEIRGLFEHVRTMVQGAASTSQTSADPVYGTMV